MTDQKEKEKHETRGQRDIRKSFATLHGWSLTFLYFSLVAWAVMIAYALIQFDLLMLTGGAFMPWLVLLGCIATFASSIDAGRRFWRAMRNKKQTPPIALMPFLSIAITIAIAGTAFAEL